MNVKKFLKQYAVYWPPAPADETGQKGFGAAVEIRCRWEDKQEVQIEPNTDKNWMSQALVFVDRVVEIEGVLWRGRYSRLTDPTSPFANAGASAIRRYNEIPDKNATENGTVRTAML